MEVKRMFSNMSMHPATLDLKLQCFGIRKLLAHNSALYHPTLMIMEEAGVLARRVGSMKLWPTEVQWKKWAGVSVAKKRGRVPALVRKWDAESERLRGWKVKKAMKKAATFKKQTKRSVFRTPKKLHILRKRR